MGRRSNRRSEDADERRKKKDHLFCNHSCDAWKQDAYTGIISPCPAKGNIPLCERLRLRQEVRLDHENGESTALQEYRHIKIEQGEVVWAPHFVTPTLR